MEFTLGINLISLLPFREISPLQRTSSLSVEMTNGISQFTHNFHLLTKKDACAPIFGCFVCLSIQMLIFSLKFFKLLWNSFFMN